MGGRFSERLRRWWATDRAGMLGGLGLLAVAVISLAPLLFEPLPREPVAAYTSAALSYVAKFVTLLVLSCAISVQALLERCRKSIYLLCALAAAMTLVHFVMVDRQRKDAAWQSELYFDILNHHRDAEDDQYRAPHQFRPLPYGFARSLELITGDRIFASWVYRWFFLYWFVWATYQFARLYLAPFRAALTVVPLALLYPFAIAFYMGQLTDPMSHALFIVSLLCVIQGRLILLAASLALGIMAKETVVIVVPAYCLYARYKGVQPGRIILRALGLGVVCIAAFLATRMPLEGWSFNNQSMNGNEQSMVTSNLLTPAWAARVGLDPPLYRSTVPMSQNYLQPLLFVGSSTSRGERPKDRPCTASQVLATVYQAIGIDPAKTFPNGNGRPMYILDDREVLTELLG